MYALFNDGKTWLQGNLPHDRLVSRHDTAEGKEHRLQRRYYMP